MMSLSSRDLLLAGVFFTLPILNCGAQPTASRAPTQREERTVAGAIRWDAWHGDRSEVGKAVQRSLSPEKWHGRLPFFAQILGRDQVRIDGTSQGIMDREIQYARSANLNYWAFLLYADGSAMNHGLEHYLASTRRLGLRFCLILEQGQWINEEAASKQFERATSLMADPEYQRVAGDRPLLYLATADPGSKVWGVQQAQAAMDRLRSLARKKNSGDPYLVVLDWRPQRANALRVKMNADAISSYSYQRDGKDAPFAQLAQETEDFWDECRSTGSSVVPIVMTGWDRRPRVERPVFWETWQKPNVGIEKFYRSPTAAELSHHLADAVAWIKAHPDAAPAKAILIYAWNENDEGGWLVPTLMHGTWPLQAIRNGLRNAAPDHRTRDLNSPKPAH